MPIPPSPNTAEVFPEQPARKEGEEIEKAHEGMTLAPTPPESSSEECKGVVPSVTRSSNPTPSKMSHAKQDTTPSTLVPAGDAGCETTIRLRPDWKVQDDSKAVRNFGNSQGGGEIPAGSA